MNHRLSEKIAEFQEAYDLLTAKIKVVREAFILAIQPDEQFRLQHELARLDEDRARLEKQLDDLEQQAARENGDRLHASNPFGDTGPLDDPARWFGREELLRQLFETLGKGENLSLLGASRSGKTSLLRKLCADGSGQPELAGRSFVYLDLQCVHDEGDFFDALCAELEIVPACRGFKLSRLLRKQGRHRVLCLDQIERMTSRLFSGDERGELRGLAEDGFLSLVIASRSPLDVLFPDSPLQTSPLAGICRIVEVPPFSLDDLRVFLASRLRGTGVGFSEAEIQRIWAQSQGHAGEMQRAARAVYGRYAR